MRKLLVFFVAFALVVVAARFVEARSVSSHTGSHHVSSYTRKDGTRVRAHERTNPNHSKLDNWSTKGNVNPNTGKRGTVDPHHSRR